MGYHGKHSTIDIQKFFCNIPDDAYIVFNLMKKSLQQFAVKIVHEQLIFLGEDGSSPPGFTSVLLIDESHMTAHCYSENGWLAIDLFTCGRHDAFQITKNFLAELLLHFPSITIVDSQNLYRFPYPSNQLL